MVPGAVNPYLAFETLADMSRVGMLPKDLTLDQAKKHYIKAANKGIIKVASKMGISTVQSYRGLRRFSKRPAHGRRPGSLASRGSTTW